MAEHAVKDVAYHPRGWVLPRVGWSMLAAGSVAKEWEMSAHPWRCGLWQNLLAVGDIVWIFVLCIGGYQDGKSAGKDSAGESS